MVGQCGAGSSPVLARRNCALRVAGQTKQPMRLKLTTLLLLLTPLWAGAAVRTTATVMDEDEWTDALNNGVDRIILGNDISVEASRTIPKDCTVVFNNFMLVKHPSFSPVLTFEGEVVADRQQIFKDWPDAGIRGAFGVIYPEWWGLNPASAQVAINTAIKAFFPGSSGRVGNIVSLAGGNYTITAPIDLSQSSSVLEGAGSGRTAIFTSSSWSTTTSAVASPLWGGDTHQAMVWIGTDVTNTTNDFFTGVRGVTLVAEEAAKKDLQVRISGISAKGWVEENSIIEDVAVVRFTGFGIGFVSPTGGAMVLNGLTIRNFWIMEGLMADAYPLYFPPHSVVVNVEGGTLDMRVAKDQSRDYKIETKASNTLVFTMTPNDGEVVTIDNRVYTFKDTLTGANQVKRGHPARGVPYGSPTRRNPSLTAVLRPSTTIIDLTANSPGVEGNLTTATTVSGASFANSTLTGGTASAKAAGVLTFTTNPGNNTTVTLGTAAQTYYDEVTHTMQTVTRLTQVYTFKSALTTPAQVAGEVLIGATLADSVNNLVDAIAAGEQSAQNLLLAINGGAGAGQNYGNSTAAHTVVDAFAGTLASQNLGNRGILPVDGKKVSVGSLDYTFKDIPSAVRHVQIPGKKFGAPTLKNPYMTASGSATTVEFTAIEMGHGGNAHAVSDTMANYTSASVETGNHQTWAKRSLSKTGGTDTINNGETVTVAGVVYTFKSSLTGAANEILIDGTAALTLQNLRDAIGGAAHASLMNLAKAINASTPNPGGAYYYTGTAAHPDVTASEDIKNLSLLITAKEAKRGPAGNLITLTTDSTALVAGGPALDGGRPPSEMVVTAKNAGAAGNIVSTTTPAWPNNNGRLQWLGGGSLNGGADDLPTLPAYVFIREFPRAAIHAQGMHLNINNVHIEGTSIGVNVVQGNTNTGVTLSNIDVNHMMDDGDVYYESRYDRRSLPTMLRQQATYPDSNGRFEPHFWKYSTAVLVSGISGWSDGAQNVKDRATMTTITSQGRCSYLLRDPMYNIDHGSFGRGQYPNGSASAFSFYTRGDACVATLGIPPDAQATYYYRGYAPNVWPNNTKKHFFGPIE